MKSRDEIAREECTRDPIFLFQQRRVVPNSDCLAEYDDELNLIHPDTKKVLSNDDLLELGWGYEHWDTLTVFLTREEGEEFGERTSYRYGRGRKNIDWKVYCMPCEGELAQILKFISIQPEIQARISLWQERKELMSRAKSIDNPVKEVVVS